MNLTDLIAQTGGSDAIEAMGRRFNLDETQTRAAIDQLSPAVMAGVRREAASPDQLPNLIRALSSGNHQRYLDGDEQGIVDDGNAILGHLFGSKDVSRGVAAHAADTTGIGADTLKQMLPMIAAMVMGALGKKTMGNSGGGIGDLLGSLLGGGTGSNAGTSGGSGGLGDILGQVLGGGAAGGGGLGGLLNQITGGQGSRATPSPGGGGLDDILGSLFGAGAPPEVRNQAVKRAGGSLTDLLGGNSPNNKAADDFLAQLQRLRR